MKTKIIIIVILSFIYSCNSTKSKKTNSKPLIIQSAFYQNWYGGREGIRGVKIKIKGEVSIKNCEYTTIYYTNKKAKIDTKTENNIISLKANINTSTRNKMLSNNRNDEYSNKPPNKLKYPNLSNNEAIIEYIINEELKTMKIELTQKESEYYP